MPEWEHFKVDGLILNDPSRGRFLVANFNVPLAVLREPSALRSALQTVGGILVNDLQGAVRRIYYSTTATYSLVHRVTGEERDWTGSFQPRNQSEGFITPYQQFVPSEFVSHLEDKLNLDAVTQRLSWQGLTSVWAFNSLRSVIITANTVVPHGLNGVFRNSRIFGAPTLRALAEHRQVQFVHHFGRVHPAAETQLAPRSGAAED